MRSDVDISHLGIAELTVSLWFCSAVFVLRAVVHAIVLIVRKSSAA
jgi:hypothetical protein